MVVPQTVKNHPNSSLSGVLSLVALGVIYGAGRLGADLNTTQAVAISGGIVTAGLRVGRAGGQAITFFAKRGVIGCWHAFLRGEGDG